MKKRDLVVPVITGMLGGCGHVDRDWVAHDGGDEDLDSGDADGGMDGGTDSDVDSDVDADSDNDTDDAGPCGGVMCYEEVGPATDDIGMDGMADGAAIQVRPGVRIQLLGHYSLSYARVASFRLVGSDGKEIDAGDLPGAAVDERMADFGIRLPEGLAAGRYRLFLYGTGLDDVREYQTFPAKRYTLEVDDDG